MISLICEIYKSNKMIQMNLFTNQKQIHTSQHQTYGYQREIMRGSDKLGVWD